MTVICSQTASFVKVMPYLLTIVVPVRPLQIVAKPDEHPLCSTVYLGHELDLVIALLYVCLVDTYGIRPQPLLLCRQSNGS
jgi:hypothetical protein